MQKNKRIKIMRKFDALVERTENDPSLKLEIMNTLEEIQSNDATSEFSSEDDVTQPGKENTAEG